MLCAMLKGEKIIDPTKNNELIVLTASPSLMPYLTSFWTRANLQAVYGQVRVRAADGDSLTRFSVPLRSRPHPDGNNLSFTQFSL